MKHTQEEIARANNILSNIKTELETGESLILFLANYGKGLRDYFRIVLVRKAGTKIITEHHLTWAVGVACDLPLRDLGNELTIALSGYGYSKTLEIAFAIERHLGLPAYSLRYEVIRGS